MDNQTVQNIRDLISKHEQIVVVVGRNAGTDEMGAALALYLVLSNENKRVSIASVTEPLVEVSHLVGIDKVKTSLDGEGGDLIVSFPYRDKDIQKVSYTLEDGYLNIIVKAGENGLSFTQRDVQFKTLGGVPTLLFVIGTPRIADLGNLYDTEALKDTIVVNIDNKPNNQGFGDVVLVNPKSSSVSEQLAQLLTTNFEIDVDIAQNLLSGIAAGTNNFQDSKTSYIAFEMAAYLMKKGAMRTQTFKTPQPQFQQYGKAQKFPQRQAGFQVPQQSQLQQYAQQRKQSPQPLQQLQTTVPVKKQQQKVENEDEDTPPDWLTPKVYKSSTLL